MPLVPISAADAAARLDSFDAIIDARSPGEFAEDHLPGAQNWPVLDDEERRVVGTEYKQVAAFEARKRGAALVARNIATHLERWVLDKPRGWQPLVYCWRGGKRSGTLAWFLNEIGFRTSVIEGGYKAFRATVLEQLEDLGARIDWRVVCGRTGSGKTRLLQALSAAGEQVLDLEDLAAHRGSVLGMVPGRPQPTQKSFDMVVWDVLRKLDLSRPVYVESESKKIGRLHVPEAIIDRMRRDGRCIRVEMPDASRVELLLEEYPAFREDTELFCKLLEPLVELRGREVVEGWQTAARQGRHAEVFLDLMHLHYDPTYLRSMPRNFRGFETATVLELANGRPQTLAAAVQRLREQA